MKKILCVLFTLFISLLCINVDAKTIYLRECEYTDEYIRWTKLSKKEQAKTIMPPMCKNDNSNKFTLVGNSASTLTNASAADSRFDLRDYGYVTDVKNQGATGSCWAFATNASIESNLLVNGKGTYDLSEAHMELSTQQTHKYNRLTFTREADTGGNYYISSAYLRNNWGSVLEEVLPFNRLEELYQNDTKIEESLILNNTAMLDVDSISMFGNSGSCSSDTIQDIKEYLITNGALTSTAHYGNTSSYNLHQYYDGKSYKDINDNTVDEGQPANHAVTIVGWDDTISKDSFLTDVKPSRDGAFIIKNSYGIKEELIGLSEYKRTLYNNNTSLFNQNGIYSAEDIPTDFALNNINGILGLEEGQLKVENDKIMIYVGDSGYQYISYDDIHICNNLVGFFGVDTEVENYVYGYDDFGISGTVGFTRSNVAYIANIFEKKSSSDEELVELNMYFTDVGQEYEIYFADKETKDTDLATLVANGTSKFIGYNTIKIDSAKITSDKYSIIIKITDNKLLNVGVTTRNLRVDSPFKNVVFTEGVQFLSEDGIEFSDVTKDSFHFLVKAYTNTVDEITEEIVPDNGNHDTNAPDGDDDNINDPDGSNKPENNDQNEGDSGQGSDEKLPGDEEPKDDTNEDGKIEILPNDMNNKNDMSSDDESNEENANTGDSGNYIILATAITLLICSISYVRLRKVK